MLSEAEKQHIALQEKYRAEIASTFKSPAKINIVETITKILQGLAIIVGIGATYHEFKKYNDEKLGKLAEETRQANRDFSKIFYQQQLATYAEAVEAVAILANEKSQTEDYKTSRKKFERLYWGRLSLVEDKRVEARMIQFRLLLLNFEGYTTTEERVWSPIDSAWISLRNVTQSALQSASLKLAHDARARTLTTWLSPAEQINYNGLK